jgi:Ca2+-binding EF-hand superfamily protein
MSSLDFDQDGKVSREEYLNHFLERKGKIAARTRQPKRRISDYTDEQIVNDINELRSCKDKRFIDVMCKRVFEHLDEDKNDSIEPQEIKTFLARQYQKESDKILKLFNFMPEAEKKQTIAEFDSKLV